MHTPILCQCGCAIGQYVAVIKAEYEYRVGLVPKGSMMAYNFRGLSDGKDAPDLDEIFRALCIDAVCCRITILTALEYKNQ